MKHLCPILDRQTDVDDTDYSRDGWTIVRCRETGFVFLANPPDYAALDDQFAWQVTMKAERQRRQTEDPVVYRLSSFVKRTRRAVLPRKKKITSLALAAGMARPEWGPVHVLDVGCAGGPIMVDLHQRFKTRGREAVPHGIEVSHDLAAVATDQVAGLGGTVIHANAMDGASQLDPRSIHVMVLSSFLEHESRPLRLLRRLGDALAPDGVVVLKVPNFACWNRLLRGRRWCGFRYPDHVNYFTPPTLRRLAREAGFAVQRQTVMDRSPLNDNMYAILTKRA